MGQGACVPRICGGPVSGRARANQMMVSRSSRLDRLSRMEPLAVLRVDVEVVGEFGHHANGRVGLHQKAKKDTPIVQPSQSDSSPEHQSAVLEYQLWVSKVGSGFQGVGGENRQIGAPASFEGTDLTRELEKLSVVDCCGLQNLGR